MCFYLKVAAEKEIMLSERITSLSNIRVDVVLRSYALEGSFICAESTY
jgi:hypothetical protein